MKNTRIINASGVPLGRLAGSIAHLLQGKNNVSRLPHVMPKTVVIVKNVENVSITKKKMVQKVYRRTSGHPGAVKELLLRDAFLKSPSAVVTRTVKGMLPSNKRRAELLKNLRFA